MNNTAFIKSKWLTVHLKRSKNFYVAPNFSIGPTQLCRYGEGKWKIDLKNVRVEENKNGPNK